MEQPALKRSADFAANEDSAQKRVRTTNGYALNVDTDGAFQRRLSINSRSPGSPKQTALQSAEVAADFKDSLQDLVGNDRYQISNLTIIAKESTEHALAISKVLENHIQKTSPPRKLPALYVLDSIVKNVGTPYTIYLGQNLFKTFMEAYTLVDGQTRKNMEGMLKTWKEPIPGSMEARPVFPVDIVRPIENALIKARTVFIQQQQQQARTQRQFHALPPRPTVTASPQPWNGTPTPSQTEPRFAPPPLQQPEQRFPSIPDFQYGSATPQTNYQSQAPQTPSFYQNQFPPSTQQQQQQQQQYQQQQPQQNLPQPAPAPLLPQLQNPYSLAALLQAAGSLPPPTPQPQQIPVTLPPAPQTLPPSIAFPGLEALFKHTSTPDVQSLSFLKPQLHVPPQVLTPTLPFATPATSTPPTAPANIARPILPAVKNDVQLTIASLKIPRPQLLSSLYSSMPSQCATCGRRFATDPASKAAKARHLDAHFRTNRSLADAARRGISRNWFLDELEWIRSREIDDADEAPIAPVLSGDAQFLVAGGAGGGGIGVGMGMGNGVLGVQKQKDVYVKAPADAAVARHACPICQEEFAAVWHDGAQEWVWMDVVNVGGRAYHKSCLEELAKDKGGIGGGGSLNGGIGMKGKVEFGGGVKREVQG